MASTSRYLTSALSVISKCQKNYGNIPNFTTLLYLFHCILIVLLLNFFVFSYKDKVVCVHHPDAPLIEDYRAGDMICSECGLIVGDR